MMWCLLFSMHPIAKNSIMLCVEYLCTNCVLVFISQHCGRGVISLGRMSIWPVKGDNDKAGKLQDILSIIVTAVFLFSMARCPLANGPSQQANFPCHTTGAYCRLALGRPGRAGALFADLLSGSVQSAICQIK